MSARGLRFCSEFDFLHIYHISMVPLRLLVPFFVNCLSLALGKMEFLSYRDKFVFVFVCVLGVLGKVSDWVVW